MPYKIADELQEGNHFWMTGPGSPSGMFNVLWRRPSVEGERIIFGVQRGRKAKQLVLNNDQRVWVSER